MKRFKMNSLILMVSLSFCVNLLAGCSTQKTGTSTGSTSGNGTSSGSSGGTQQPSSPVSADDKPIYPLEGSPKIKYWVGLASNVTSYATNFSELPFRQNLEAATGILVEYIHPAGGQELETLNILIASGDYPDIIEYAWPGYPGGVMKLYNDGVIHELSDLMAQYAPNLTAYYEANPEIARQVKSDDGKFYLVPFIRGSKELRHTSGPMLRADWLKANGHEPPKTIAEWEVVLTGFKENQKAVAPFTGTMNQILSTFVLGFEVQSNFYPDQKTVKFGPAEDGYKEFLTVMADWYAKGLIDSNFATVDRTIQDSNMTTDKAGSTFGAGGGQMGPYIRTAQAANPEYNLITTTLPTKNPGEKPKYMNSFEFTSNGHAVITTSSKNPEVAMRFLDYARSEEGHILYNFGMEGESFTYVNGVPTYTDLIMKNPDGLTVAQAMSKYSWANVNGPFTQAVEYIQQFYEMPQQKQALIDWSYSDDSTSVLPPITFTPEESAEVARIMSDINTYRDEMTMKIIMGAEPVSKVDEMQATLRSMNLDRVLQIHQTALDRYYAR